MNRFINFIKSFLRKKSKDNCATISIPLGVNIIEISCIGGGGGGSYNRVGTVDEPSIGWTRVIIKPTETSSENKK